MFIDRAIVECFAGKGGNGVIAWRREKFIPKGGPSGGNGGKGAAIIIQADHNVYSLDWFSYKRHIRAPNGASGSGGCKNGKNGQDLILKVPCGTLIKDAKTGEVLFDCTQDGEQFVLCKGGKGGKGNFTFRSSTNRAPNIATPGTEGEVRKIEFELKLIADIGLIGFPNSGKSTLIKQLADVEVKIAPYPFTTLRPNLGYVYYNDGTKVLLADIPGIISGAHKNRGLGFEFLRHIERTKAIIYVIDAAGFDGRDPIEDFKVLQQELEAYDPKLLKKPFLIVLNKADLEDAEAHAKAFTKAFKKFSKQTFLISAKEGTGCKNLQKAIATLATE